MANNALTEKPGRAILVALIVAIVCGLAVSFTAVVLRPHYVANLEAERMGRLGAILDALTDVSGETEVNKLQEKVVDLNTGEYDPKIDATTYDARKAALDPAKSTALSPQIDVAGIKRRANHAVVYLMHESQGDLSAVILPIWGVGYQSAIYGYLALAADATEILAIKFYEHGETPGLGSRIQDSEWESLWAGKQAFDDEGGLSIHVGKTGGDSENRIDAISGATRTSMGVDGMLKFWLGDNGFGPYLDRIRRREG